MLFYHLALALTAGIGYALPAGKVTSVLSTNNPEPVLPGKTILSRDDMTELARLALTVK